MYITTFLGRKGSSGQKYKAVPTIEEDELRGSHESHRTTDEQDLVSSSPFEVLRNSKWPGRRRLVVWAIVVLGLLSCFYWAIE
jgi:hypothetical protein